MAVVFDAKAVSAIRYSKDEVRVNNWHECVIL